MAKAKPKPIAEGDYDAEVDLGNGHKWKRQKETGAWCRHSPEPISCTLPEFGPKHPDMKVEMKPKAEIEAEVKAKTQAKAEAEAEVKTKPEAEAKAKPKSETEAEAQVKPKPEAEAEVKPQPELEGKPLKPKTKKQLEAEANAQAKAKAKVEKEQQKLAKGKEKAEKKATAEAKHRELVEKAKLEIGEDGTFKSPDLEEKYEKYLKRKALAKETARNRSEWKVAHDFWTLESPTVRGNNFNKTAGQSYDFNEVHLSNGKRVDSYQPPDPEKGFKGEIVSRKAVDFDDIDDSTFKSYLKEMGEKYAPGKGIKSTKYKDDFPEGSKLQGELILEVPKSNKGTLRAKALEQMALEKGVKIRYTAE